MLNAKKKGNAGENKFANWLKDNDIKAWKDGASGGGSGEKSDVGNNINAHFEVKTCKRLNLQIAWRQAAREALKTQNTPYVVVHFDGMPENEWLVVMNNWDWLSMFQKSQSEKIIERLPEENKREKKWVIENAILALKKLSKFYDLSQL